MYARHKLLRFAVNGAKLVGHAKRGRPGGRERLAAAAARRRSSVPDGPWGSLGGWWRR